MGVTPRKLAFRSVVGSHNYNLNHEGSDIDYRRFVFPTLEDLLEGRIGYGNNSSPDNDEDEEWHDVRRLKKFLAKGNIHFIEPLFSIMVDSSPLYWELATLREEIVQVNLPGLYRSTKGMVYSELKRFTKMLDEPANAETNTRLGKSGASIIRLSDILRRYITENQSFKKAIRYEDDEPMRIFLLMAKQGELDISHLKGQVNDAVSELNSLENYYLDDPATIVQEDVKGIVFNLIDTHVIDNIKPEIEGF